MQIPNNIADRTTKDWLRVLKQKTAGSFLMGLLLGIALMIGIISLAFSLI
jgi:hypothetical protein